MSDLHFGHKKVSGDHMYNNLKTYAYPQLEQCSMCILSGDIFHYLLDFNNAASRFVLQFINDLFFMSLKYKFSIRVLRGTYTHDRNQVEFLEQCAHKYMDEQVIDLKVYTKVSVDEECIDGELIRIAYLPDDIPYKSQYEVIDVVNNLLTTMKWDKVDMVIGHGYGQHVLPPGVAGPSVVYTIELLSTITKHLAIFGHVHTSSVKRYKDVTFMYVGSFERMCHGEEEKKGYICIDTTTWSIKFIENKNTLLFSTYVVPTDDVVEHMVEMFVRWMSMQSWSTQQMNYIRIVHEDADIRSLLSSVVKEQFSMYPCCVSTKASNKTTAVDEPSMNDVSELIVPTEDNLVEIISSYITDHKLYALSEERIHELLSA